MQNFPSNEKKHCTGFVAAAIFHSGSPTISKERCVSPQKGILKKKLFWQEVF